MSLISLVQTVSIKCKITKNNRYFEKVTTGYQRPGAFWKSLLNPSQLYFSYIYYFIDNGIDSKSGCRMNLKFSGYISAVSNDSVD